jgi:hypothetical protein
VKPLGRSEGNGSSKIPSAFRNGRSALHILLVRENKPSQPEDRKSKEDAAAELREFNGESTS